MARVTGIGGVFFKAHDAEALRAWYRTHLGIDIQAWGGATFGGGQSAGGKEPVTVWTVFPESSSYFSAPFMINYRVENLAAVLADLRAEGCIVDDKVDESEFGRFGWVQDPEGNRVELWEPPAGGFPG